MELSDKTNLCTAVIHLGLLACYYCISLQLTTSTYAPSRNVENTQRCRSLAKNSLSAAKCLVYIQLLSVRSSLLQSYIVIECSFLYFIFLIARHCQFFFAILSKFTMLVLWQKLQVTHSCKCNSFVLYCAL